MTIINTCVAILGILLSFIMFYRLKVLRAVNKDRKDIKLSIVIPARNESINLATLLKGIQKQTVKPYEVIVVNDQSTDNTKEIAALYGADVVDVLSIPNGWRGKNYACFLGAQSATGDVLLFLDADLILQADAVKRLVNGYKEGAVLSVQPYHYTTKPYEQLSLFFNMISVAALGVCLPGKDRSIGLFGPVLMMGKELYHSFGGHEIVKGEVLEDFKLGFLLRKLGIGCNLFLGYKPISYQMYKGGIVDLICGFSKNFASAATKTPLLYLICVVLWVSSYYFFAIDMIKQGIISLSQGYTLQLAVSVFLYLLAGNILYLKSRWIGRFSYLSSILYIIPLAGFTLIFAFSLFLKFVLKKVYWKGRWHNV